MTSPTTDASCISCVDLRASLTRVDREFARVVRDGSQYEEIARTRAERCTELLEERRARDAEIAQLRAALQRTTDALDAILGTNSDDPACDARWDEGEVAVDAARAVLAGGSIGLVLPGWTCASCRAFNGEAKAERTTRRACDALRPAHGLMLGGGTLGVADAV